MTARAVALGQVVQVVESGVDENAFGALLRRYRVAAELSQEALAERAHMSARGIRDLERGVRSKPYRGTVDQLAAALGLNAAEREALEHTARRVRDVLPERHDAVVPSEALLTTKLTIPPARSRLVARPHLLRRLGEGSRGPLTLLAAPAGSGKTTLLTAWLEDALREDRPVAWVALDERDNDPVRFSLYVAAALDKAGMTISPESRRLLQPPQPAPIEVVFTRVLNDLSVRLDDLILMLDDYHVIENEVIHQGVAFLLEHLPPQLHLVLSARIDPPLPLARLRAGGQITEVRMADLRFSRDDVGEFLA